MIDDVYFLTVEEVVAVHADQIARYTSTLVFLHQNGVETDGPHEVLYDVMIGAAAKAMFKPQIAATLRSLVVPPSE